MARVAIVLRMSDFPWLFTGMLMYGMSSTARVIVHQDDLSPERAAEGKLKDVLTEGSFVLLLIFRVVEVSVMESTEVASFLIELRILQQVGNI